MSETNVDLRVDSTVVYMSRRESRDESHENEGERGGVLEGVG